MAYLLNVVTGNCIPLMPHHSFGRLASAVNTQVDKPYISKLHAAIEWNGSRWLIKHLGLNNTWVDKLALVQGESYPLALNTIIHIGAQNDVSYKVMDLSPPVDMLWPVTASATSLPQPIYLDRFHLLPDAQAPELAVYFSEAEQQWYCNDERVPGESGTQVVNSGDLVHFANSQWQFIRAHVYGPTEVRSLPTLKLADLVFTFQLSLDEETTQLIIHQQSQQHDLGVRTHHYLLLQLARHRADDIARNLDITSQGWVYADRVATELGLDTTHMNIQIFRARKQFADSFPNLIEQPALVERLGGKIRFGASQFTIYKGATRVTASSTTPSSTLQQQPIAVA